MLRTLSGRARIEDSIINKIIEVAIEDGFIIVDIGDDFAVIKQSVMNNFRPVPKAVIKLHSPESVIRDEGDKEEDE